jgi:signal transduction histidine kinase
VPAFDPSGQVGYAINFFREVTDEVRDKEQRAFLLRAADELNSSLDYEKTLANVARLAVPVLADWCAIDLAENGKTRRAAVAHVDPTRLALLEEYERRYPPDPNAATGVPQILRSGRAEFIPEIPRQLLVAAAADPEQLKHIDALQLRSYIGVPLQVRGQTIGVLTLAMAESGRHHTERDFELAQALADRAALATENARLFSEVVKARTVATAQRDQSEEKLVVEAQRRLQAENESRFAEMFIGILGHDLRNPLNAISMAASLLKRKGSDDKTVDRILASARRMSNMVGQLLDLTRSRLAGGISVERKPGDLRAIISGILDELRLAYPDRELRWEDSGEVRGAWDQDRLAQAASNLVGNALQHGDPARPVTVRLAARKESVVVSVHSDGPPIPRELLDVIFDPYRRNTARSERSKGLGLGLFITQQIVLAHGGRLEVRSTLEEGTTFSMILPRSSTGKVAEPSSVWVS